MENLNDYTIHRKCNNLLKELGIKEPYNGMGLYHYLTHAEKYAANLYDMDSLWGDPEIHFYAKIKRIEQVWHIDKSHHKKYYFLLAHSGERGHLQWFYDMYGNWEVIYFDDKNKVEKFMVTNLPKKLWDEVFNSELVEYYNNENRPPELPF